MVRAAGDAPNRCSPPSAPRSIASIPPPPSTSVPCTTRLTFALLPSQAGALVLGSVGLLGLTLASIGLYGVLLYSVSRRIREIGLRVALGATPRAVLSLVLRHSLGLVSVGIGAGMLLAALRRPPLALFLIPDVRPTDPLNFLASRRGPGNRRPDRNHSSRRPRAPGRPADRAEARGNLQLRNDPCRPYRTPPPSRIFLPPPPLRDGARRRTAVPPRKPAPTNSKPPALTRPAALAQARREFGNAARMTEDTRSAWQFRRLEDLAADLRYAARGFRRNPAFALTAIACLALAIGANTTIFSLTTEALFSRPSVRDPQSIIAIQLGGSSHATQATWRFLRDARIFDGLAGENEEVETNWRHGESTERLFAVKGHGQLFRRHRYPRRHRPAARPRRVRRRRPQPRICGCAASAEIRRAVGGEDDSRRTRLHHRRRAPARPSHRHRLRLLARTVPPGHRREYPSRACTRACPPV